MEDSRLQSKHAPPSTFHLPSSIIPPLVVIVGPTASGKSALAMELAELFNGEIICADSRTIYTGLDIATAKPTSADRRRVKHHLLDLIDPDQNFSAAQFKKLAYQAIQDITDRGKLPILAGGSGLYIDSVIYDYQFATKPDPKTRQKLSKLTVSELQAIIKRQKLALPENFKNPRHLIRQIERNGYAPSQKKLRRHTLIVGLVVPDEVIKNNIEQRVKAMLAGGLVKESRQLVERFGQASPGLSAPGYKAMIKYLNGQLSLAEAGQEFYRNDWLLAKRQKTWFKRNKSIHWVDNRGQAIDIVTTFMYKN